jgi:predicted dehydrogenase
LIAKLGESMDFLILGAGPEEQAWAQVLAGHDRHRLVAAYPGFKNFPDLPGSADLDEALAVAGIAAAIVGGGPELRAEGLRRAAALGWPVICLHPPGPNADPYYQVALSRRETGAVIVPDLPARLHPGVAAVRAALDQGALGAARVLGLERPIRPSDGDLVEGVFPRLVDLIRAVLGEIAAVTASGDPSGDRPTEGLLVVLRGVRGPRGEIRLGVGPPEPSRLTLAGERGTLTLEFEPDAYAPARLIRREPPQPETIIELDAWDPRAATLHVLEDALAGRAAHPDLLDGTRAMELTTAVARSLHRGRTIDLHYEEISETSNFKAVMTSTGCLLLLLSLLALPVALVGPALGLFWTIYIAYAIPPVLIIFTLAQLMRLSIKQIGDEKVNGRHHDCARYARRG